MARIVITTDEKGSWGVVSRLLPYLWDHRYRVGLALVFLVLARLANVSVPLALKGIVDRLDNPDAVLVVPLALLAAYGLLRFASILFNELRNVVFTWAGIRIIQDVSARVFEHLHQLSLSFHLDRKTGGLSRDIDRGNLAVTNFLRIIVFNIVPVVIEVVMVMAILWNQLGASYVAVAMSMILVYSIFTFSITRWRTRFRVQMNESDSAANTRVLDSLLNYETVKVFGSEKTEKRRYADSLDTWAGASYRNNLSLSLLNAGQGLILAIGLTIMMVMAATGVADGTVSMGDFVMVNAFLIQLYVPLNFLGSVYRDLNHSLVDMSRMFDILDEQPEIADAPNADDLVLEGGKVEFNGVSFGFQEDKSALADISFTIPAGGTLGVVGPSGAGKSTLARLLLRFYDPDSGTVSIDGQDISLLTQHSVRSVMGVVPQDTVLFNDTIGYNIGYGKEGAGADEIERAARIAQLHEFISGHPEGYDILVGERGLKLSGGEKQRVAIARVALKGARILVFDEATSSLDSRSEKAIQLALDSVAEHTTTLIIAHRLSTVVNADEILVLDQGRIVERGTHNELVSKEGLYAQMWELQKNED